MPPLGWVSICDVCLFFIPPKLCASVLEQTAKVKSATPRWRRRSRFSVNAAKQQGHGVACIKKVALVYTRNECWSWHAALCPSTRQCQALRLAGRFTTQQTCSAQCHQSAVACKMDKPSFCSSMPCSKPRKLAASPGSTHRGLSSVLTAVEAPVVNYRGVLLFHTGQQLQNRPKLPNHTNPCCLHLLRNVHTFRYVFPAALPLLLEDD